MSIVRKRPRRSPRLAYYRSQAWYARRARVQARAHGWCEFCRQRPMSDCHHRTYRHFGQEPLFELMAVCSMCHRWIHGRGRRGTAGAGSLMAQGDSGRGLPAVWLRYLQGLQRREHAA